MKAEQRDYLKRIPSVDVLLREPEIARLRDSVSHETLVGLIRDALDQLRRRIMEKGAREAELSGDRIAESVAHLAAQLVRPPLRPVINCTGILIHTNLGRAPLSAGAQEAAARVAAGYSNLEIDLETGRRMSRLKAVCELLRRVSGAEDALAVNNNAAAVFLILHTLAAGREVVVSRGELVEIGGSFRLPDIMSASGAILREVGTTNRTRISDYADAVTERTGLILHVHPSNFVVQGFAESVSIGELADLARERNVPLVDDIGSGAMEQHPEAYLSREPRVQDSLRAGADLVCFSGDKLFGGPQAGVILGRASLVTTLRNHPVARVVRLDKLHLAALEATLLAYLQGSEGVAQIPLYRMMSRTAEELEKLGATMIERLKAETVPGWRYELARTEAAAGGGSLPGESLDSVALVVRMPSGSMNEFARFLRVGDPSIVGRIEQDSLILDLRTLNEDEHTLLPALLTARVKEFARLPGEG